jgi:hypothetical protein
MTTAETTDTDYWHVQLLSGEVRYWSLEELDDAFQKDLVDAKTYVLKEGETTWMRLGELLGLDEAESAPAPVVSASSAPIAPVYVMPVSAMPGAPISVAPPSYGYGANDAGANSIRPVVSDMSGYSDLDDDDLAAAMKPKKKKIYAIAGGAGAALLLLIVGITQASGGSSSGMTAAGAQPPAAVAPPAADPVPADQPAPQATLSDDMKRQLLAADKAREAKSAAKAAENAKYQTKKTSYRAPKSGQVFHKGGNKYDPLNSGN